MLQVEKMPGLCNSEAPYGHVKVWYETESKNTFLMYGLSVLSFRSTFKMCNTRFYALWSPHNTECRPRAFQLNWTLYYLNDLKDVNALNQLKNYFCYQMISTSLNFPINNFVIIKMGNGFYTQKWIRSFQEAFQDLWKFSNNPFENRLCTSAHRRSWK